MRYVVYGVGAVGGVVAAHLFAAEREVVAIARGPHLQAIQANGLRIDTPNGSRVMKLLAVGGPREIEWRPDDVVVLCMKTQDTPSALAALHAAAGSQVPIVCCQNGVANERIALRRFSHVYGMVVMLPAAHDEPGVVVAQSKAAPGILDAGCYPAGTDARIAAITHDFEAATFSARPDPTVMRLKYAKLKMNLGNALQAVCADRRGAGDLLRRAREEADAAYAGAGIDCATDFEFAERRGELIQPAPVGGRMRGGGSSWQSLARGLGSIEADYLNGEICLLGALCGVPTPVNRAVADIASDVARLRGAPNSVPLADIEARVAALEERTESPADHRARR
jgi:2-dehydropantoate 2-reductase